MVLSYPFLVLGRRLDVWKFIVNRFFRLVPAFFCYAFGVCAVQLQTSSRYGHSAQRIHPEQGAVLGGGTDDKDVFTIYISGLDTFYRAMYVAAGTFFYSAAQV